MTEKMPVFFVGHGSPMNAITDNVFSRGFAGLSAGLTKPRAILAISAHWYVPGTWLTMNQAPPTIHDFGGFPAALSQVSYRAPGAPDLALQISKLLDGPPTDLKLDWGLDHGTWSVLKHAYPEADVPVVQLSINERCSAAEHLAIGHRLRDLRSQGVLIVASGNVTHNLRELMAGLRQGLTETPAWAARFDASVVQVVEARDSAKLSTLLTTEDGRRAHPTPDHWWPLLYAVGASTQDDPVSYPIEGWDGGSLSMRAIRFG